MCSQPPIKYATCKYISMSPQRTTSECILSRSLADNFNLSPSTHLLHAEIINGCKLYELRRKNGLIDKQETNFAKASAIWLELTGLSLSITSSIACVKHQKSHIQLNAAISPLAISIIKSFACGFCFCSTVESQYDIIRPPIRSDTPHLSKPIESASRCWPSSSVDRRSSRCR